MKIYRLVTVTEHVVKAMQALIVQLTSNCELPNREVLEHIVNSDSTLLFLAEDNNEIIGTMTLVLNKIPTGDKVWIEDVVVDQAARGKGVGKALIEAAITYATENNIEKINLTSKPEKVAGNRLYQKMGFVQRETNVYRYTIG
ncbi:GNAT family N-acetyltransferase [Algibacter miyuki]|uniref:GNAT family N-acetyltransferase n=1 Tax=Algibacter miyuki TaxID=1306933 RepID=A0ABV5H2I3_9FLAO|nr:GNAT family N-acetyltransferase [Algibacter miyuki]MDN3664507.1 GNAT family N-acetyltransferase [Algibacter miyuki]